jgi:hypothetical protein
MGILRITMRKTSSQSVSGAFTALEFTQLDSEELLRVNDRKGLAMTKP